MAPAVVAIASNRRNSTRMIHQVMPANARRTIEETTNSVSRNRSMVLLTLRQETAATNVGPFFPGIAIARYVKDLARTAPMVKGLFTRCALITASVRFGIGSCEPRTVGVISFITLPSGART